MNNMEESDFMTPTVLPIRSACSFWLCLVLLLISCTKLKFIHLLSTVSLNSPPSNNILPNIVKDMI